ncbi:single-strand DNA endonuclease 1 isoform X1 [Beta vulgaris subsp. vulgaris]|uniref:single-strand DNA endonuclease 1 isoform X1 n=2 Tax=Beta vulgaris subsp. vulgaris TaxID=3555 RepID=UPI0020376080|nr:single-strand DNA endonuclease 1 isoform X1 [Beta vulgaris subsp. vulgaris]
MGVKNLWDILEPCKKTLPLHHLQNKRVCIDLSCWMVQLQKVNRTYCAMKEKLYLRGLFHRLRALISLNCSVIFVTDGAIPAIKISTYRKRLNSVNEVTQDDVDKHKLVPLRRNMGSEFSCMIREAKTLGMALGVPCLDGIEEAEAQCALLNSESLCDGCFTSDSDVFLFGARTVYRDICLEKGGYVVCYEMTDIENKLGLGRRALVALALLLGSDYSHGVRGFGPDSACQVVRSISEDLVLQHVASDGLSFLKSLKTSKKHGQYPECLGKENFADQQVKFTEHQLPLDKDKEVLSVIEAYMKPKCHSADSDPVYRVLAVLPFQRDALQQICSQFFDWPPEKTDEYILPKIAERELRRFANLRSSSSQLGVTLPLHMMPKRCPISEVLKHRKVQGRECFEVSWEEFDGLKTSIVPADLLESACPEKIAEFEERKVQIKKQNRRKPKSKKLDDTASVANVDTRLQNLLLDIEYEENNSRFKPTQASVISVDLRTESPLLNLESEDNTRCKPTSSSSLSAAGSSFEVDLTVSENDNYVSNINDKSPFDHQLNVESEDNARCKSTSCSSSSASGSSVEVDLTISDTEDYARNINNRSTSDDHLDCPMSMDTDVIDLISPSPRLKTRYISKCQGNVELVNIIDLSDSDMEITPEQAQKARDLRLSLARIR